MFRYRTPPEPDPALWDPLAARLRESFNYWLERKQTQIHLSPEAKRKNDSYYVKLFHREASEPMIQTLSDRHRVHVRKAALIFAALDMVNEIKAEHFSAAIEYTEFLCDALTYTFRGYNLSTWAKDEHKIVEAVLNAPEQRIFRRDLQRRFRMDGESFQRRVKAVAGYPDDPSWDGPLRQTTIGNGRVLISNNEVDI